MRCYICGLKREGKCTMVKKIIIGILAVVGGIFLVFGIIVGFFLVSDFKQEDKLETEIEGFWEMTYKLETLDYEEVYARANRVVTKDDYALVESCLFYTSVLDLHRDGVADGTRLVTNIGGKDTAQLMFLNGLCRTAANGPIEYLQNPYLTENLAFSFKLQAKAAQYYPCLLYTSRCV